MLEKNWWKPIGILILLYVFIAGMLVPLKTGIENVTPSSTRTGDTVALEVLGYNSNYAQDQAQIRAWLKMDDDHAIAAKRVEVRGERDLVVEFDIPDYLPSSNRVQDFSLLVDNPTDGAHVFPAAVFVTQDSIDPSQGKQSWVNAEIADLHKREGITFPYRNILAESIRNTYFHVSLWLAMLLIFLGGVVASVRYLRTFDLLEDRKSLSYTRVGILLGVLGLITGAIWAKNTWGAYWSWDVKQNMTAIALLIYLAYFVLRNSFEDPERKARLSAVYNIFAFATLSPLLYVIPRMTDSLHPGNGGNPALGGEDLDNTMRMVFYPAVIGWTLFSLWMVSISYRIERLWLQRIERWDDDDD